MFYNCFLALAGLVVVARGSSSKRPLPNSDLSALNYRHIVVISDIHGDDLAFIRSLWIGYCKTIPRTPESPCPVTFDELRGYFDLALTKPEALPETLPLYRGSEIALIQMGDFIDRGPYGKRSILIFHQVKRVIGWDALNLYGNHELVAMLGDSVYDSLIHPLDDDIDRKTEIRRKGPLHQLLLDTSLFMVRIKRPSNIPLGHPQDPSTLFVHAGLRKSWLEKLFPETMAADEHIDVHKLNTELQRSMREDSENALLGDHIDHDHSSLITTRYMAVDPNEDAVCDELFELLKKFDVSRVVVGHTPQVPTREMSWRCNGRFILTDVAMSRFMPDKMVDPKNLDAGFPSTLVFNILPGGILHSIRVYYTEFVSGNAITGLHLIDPPEEQIQRLRAQKEAEAKAASLAVIDGPDKENTVQNGDAVGNRKRKASHVQRFEVIYSDSVVSIREATLDNAEGFVLNPRTPNAVLAALPKEVLSYIGVPKISLIQESQNSTFYFLHTRSKVPLGAFSRFGFDQAVEITDMMSYFHKYGKCLGFQPVPQTMQNDRERWIRMFFTVDNNGQFLTLINLTRVVGCTQQSLHAEELFVRDALARHLKANDENIAP